ncbi:MAG: hypothetical protein V4850_08895 [Myxococcota bacterium]
MSALASLALLVSGAAQAVPADVAECYPHVTESLPHPGATGVPLDIQPTVAIAFVECGPAEWTLQLAEQGSGAVVATATVAATLGIAALELCEPLAGDTAYVLRVTDESGWVEPAEIGFTTGMDTADTTPWAPVLTRVSAGWYEPSGPLVVGLTAAQPDGAATSARVELGDVGPTATSGTLTPRVAALLGTAPAGVPHEWTVGLEAGPDTWCVSGRGQGAQGAWFEQAEPVCVTVETLHYDTGEDIDVPKSERGCSTSEHGPSALFVATGLLTMVVRRRRG